ncbi:MAG: hypothetical protein P1P76_05110 [Anaerolineales bacterium]|nr:hypothetical protein [Anaerolineales bacterium]
MRYVIWSCILGLVLMACTASEIRLATPTFTSTSEEMIRKPTPTTGSTPSPTLAPTFTPLPTAMTIPGSLGKPYEAIEFPAADEAAYRQALIDLEANRKGALTLAVVDNSGEPLESYLVSYKQTAQDFIFSVWDEPYALRYLKDLGINGFQSNLWWSFVEPELGSFRLSFLNRFKGIEEVSSGGLSYYAQDVFSASDTYPMLPQGDFEKQMKYIQRHLTRLVSRFADDVDIWEAYLEPEYTFNNPYRWSRQQYLVLVKLSADIIRKYDPTAQISINQSIPCDYSQRQKIVDILEYGINFDILGLQFYYNSFTNPIYSFQAPHLSLAEINRCLEQYGTLLESYGVLIGASEMSLPSEAPSWVPGYAGYPWSEDLQAQYFEYLATISFSKPYVMGINWFKGMDDPGGFILNGGLVDFDLTPKKSYLTYQTMIRSWTNSGQGILNSEGQIEILGFGGEYEVVIEDPETDRRMATNVHLREGEQKTLTVTFEPQIPFTAELEKLELLLRYWEEAGNDARTQSGRDYLALLVHHIGLNEIALAQQTYKAAVDLLSIPIEFTLRGPTDLYLASYGRDKPIVDRDSQVIWSADTLFYPFDFPKGEIGVTVKAAAAKVGEEWPHMVIGVGSNYSEIIEVNQGSTESYTFQTTLTGGEEVLTIRYPEEDCSNVGECKLFILTINVNITTEELPAE